MRERTGKIDVTRLTSLAPIFAEDAGIVLVFLFGSYAQNHASVLSDVDLALLLSMSVTSDEYLNYRVKYANLAMETLRDERVDVVILNTAPPLLRHQAIKGRVLFERSPEARVEFVVDVQRKYLDLKPFYAIDYAYMKQRLKDGTFGKS
ncbi:MAG: nucleotidyltransferase domain-containing protein [Chloroflexi bacterium]|nr:nucleotidyltransferase domain-containing protein [Chloroflexota bacterium]